MKYTCINIQGNLISEEILQKIEKAEAQGQLAGDFWLEPGTNLRSEIEYAWSRIKLDWKHFSERSQNLPLSDQYGTTLSRKWMEQFLNSIGFHLDRQKSSLQGSNSQTYTISHTAENIDQLPIHIVGFFEPNHTDKNTLDIKTSGGTSRFSPHGTMQEYLNVTDHLYGIATNGLFLRLIRDTGRLIKLTYLEFDIKRMLDEDKYSEFTILYRILHASRFPGKKEESDQCLIEKYYNDSIETGNRIRDGLSLAVKESLVALGKGFLQHENNSSLREKIQSGILSSKNYYRQLLRIIYRFLFLMVTEERDLIYDPDDKSEKIQRFKKLYFQFYSIHRLRKLSENRYVYEGQFTDLWQGLVNTFLLFEASGNGNELGIQPLDGDLFSYNAISDLQNSLINNKLLLECVRNLNEFTDENKNLVPINYRSLDVEELGSVYEGLLELHPIIETIEATNPAHINFTFHEGTDRKTTGSYYTRPELVNELIKSALIPIIEERLKEHSGNKESQAKSLLSLKVCDAAAGSGHMLLAAARTIAWYLARVQSGEENPAPSVYRGCLREVIQHCIYAVDFNPDAVELCKLALWLEGHNSGKPLSFLDHKIRNGNSLVGVADLNVLKKGIPDDAFNPVTGDDKDICIELKKINAQYNKTKQRTIDFDQIIIEESHTFSTDYHQMEQIKQDNVDAVLKVKTKFEKLRNNRAWFNDWNACNLWTSAFFFQFSQENKQSAPTSERLSSFKRNPAAAYGPMIGKSNALAIEHKFFHWPLEFPDVFEQGGFDVMLGNPPWERIKLEEKEFFATKDQNIAKEKNKSKRVILINQLIENNPSLYDEFINAKHYAESESKFCRASNRFILSAVGDMNTFQLFFDLFKQTTRINGKAGIIIPTGIATNDTTKDLFSSCIKEKKIESFYGFINSKKIFKDIKDYITFALITLGKSEKANFCFSLTDVQQIQDKRRIFTLTLEDLERINPNTKTAPVFRTGIDAELTKKLYSKTESIINEDTNKNHWGISFHSIFHMSNDSKYFNEHFDEGFLPLYEAKMIYHYDHRFSTYENATDQNINEGNLPQLNAEEHSNPSKKVIPHKWIKENIVREFLARINYTKKYFIGFRGITGNASERTLIFSYLPLSAVGNSCPIIKFKDEIKAYESLLFVSCMNNLITDYVARQKIGGPNLNFFILKQLPTFQLIDYLNFSEAIIKRTVELTYSSYDIKPFADDVWKDADDSLKAAIQKQWEENKYFTGGNKWNPPECCVIDEEGCPLSPFKWDENRRAVLKAELDAIYAMLYGLTTEELCYILDPEDVYGSDFPGETFRVLKDKEIRIYGEYRTKRLVLDAWERLNKEQLEIPLSISKVIKPVIKETKTNIPAMKEFSLNEGIYSVQDVVQITHLKAEKVRRWFNELSKANYEGLSSVQKLDLESMRISFHGLIELVVIGTLRENSFSLKKILNARNDLKSKTNKIYPFATNNVRDDLKVTDKTIVFNFPTGYVTLDGSGQYNLSFIVQFFNQIEFDVDGIASKLFPLTESKLIVIDPRQSGGKAAINGKGVWVDTISSAYSGQNSIDIIQDQFDLTKEEVLAALEYYQ